MFTRQVVHQYQPLNYVYTGPDRNRSEQNRTGSASVYVEPFGTGPGVYMEPFGTDRSRC